MKGEIVDKPPSGIVPRDLPAGMTDDNRCIANVRSCPIDRGGCGYRYPAGAGKWQDGFGCPECGLERRCTQWKVTGYTVCRMHGAGSPNQGRGGSSAGGRWGDKVPRRLRERYESGLMDDQLLDLRHDIVVLDLRIGEILEALEDDPHEIWIGATQAYDDFQAARATGKVRPMLDALERLGVALRSGGDQKAMWSELQSLLNQRVSMVRAYTKQLESAHQMITVERLLIVIEHASKAFRDAVFENVEDEEIAARIAGQAGQAIRRLLH